MVRAVPGYFKRAPCLVLAGPLCRRGAARGRVMATTGGVSRNQGGACEGPEPDSRSARVLSWPNEIWLRISIRVDHRRQSRRKISFRIKNDYPFFRNQEKTKKKLLLNKTKDYMH